MCASMADIQSATAEIRRGKKKERKKKTEETTCKNIIFASATQGGHNNDTRTTRIGLYPRVSAPRSVSTDRAFEVTAFCTLPWSSLCHFERSFHGAARFTR